MKQKETVINKENTLGITITNCEDHQQWNNFLEQEMSSQMVTIAHNPSLGKILAKSFGYRHQNYWLEKDGQKIGVLPTVIIGKKIVSMPHFSYGGPIIAKELNETFEINQLIPSKKFEIRGFEKLTENVYDKKLSCVLDVHKTEDEQMMSLKSKLRQKIRKSLKIGFEVRHGGVEFLNEFYHMYALKMLKFGSPPIGKKFFENLLNDYTNGEATITLVYDKDKVIAAAFSLSYLNFNEVCWSATNSSYDRLNLHALICWEILKLSVNKGHTYFSFGRSTIGSNNHQFKKQWNPIQLPIYYNYSEPIGKSIKEHTFLTKIWKLQPLKTSIYFGHLISKYVY